MFLKNIMDLKILHSCDAEYWGPFIEPVVVNNLKGKKYQCNNPIKLVAMNDEVRSLYLKKNFTELCLYLNHYLSDFGICFNDGDIFFKLSTISGKDIIPDNIFTEDFENIDQYTNFIQKLNPEMIQEYWKTANQLSAEKLIIKSIEQLTDQLLTSERINLYIKTANYMVFRNWMKYEIQNEFRCFIYKKKLVAISQYDYFLPLPNPEYAEQFLKIIEFFFLQVSHLIPFVNVVMDVAIENGEVYFIEFNPFGNNSDTDAGLYDWVKDQSILVPLEFSDRIDIRLFDMEYINRKFQL